MRNSFSAIYSVVRTKLSPVLIGAVTLVWIVVLCLYPLRQALLSPNFYYRWLRDNAVLAFACDELTQVLLADIPDATLSLWIPRDAERLQRVLDTAFAPSQFETLLVDEALSWAKWLFGLSPSPDAFTVRLGAYVQSPAGDAVCTALWQNLPMCTTALPSDAPPPYCMPTNEAARPMMGQKQQVWWNDYSAALINWAITEESNFLATLPLPPFLLTLLGHGPWVAGILLIVTVFYVPPSRRWRAVRSACS